MTRRRLRHLVAVPALATALALLVSGCGTREAGAAAVVGDRRISVAAVQTAYQDLVMFEGPDQGVTQAQILNLLILEPYLTEAAAEIGRGISNQDARASLTSAANGVDPDFSAPGLDVWRAILAFSELQADRQEAESVATLQSISAALEADGVDINPRFGSSYNFEGPNILSERPNWFATPPTDQAVPAP